MSSFLIWDYPIFYVFSHIFLTFASVLLPFCFHFAPFCLHFAQFLGVICCFSTASTVAINFFWCTKAYVDLFCWLLLIYGFILRLMTFFFVAICHVFRYICFNFSGTSCLVVIGPKLSSLEFCPCWLWFAWIMESTWKFANLPGSESSMMDLKCDSTAPKELQKSVWIIPNTDPFASLQISGQTNMKTQWGKA